jgi:hypothetical protein
LVISTKNGYYEGKKVRQLMAFFNNNRGESSYKNKALLNANEKKIYKSEKES